MVSLPAKSRRQGQDRLRDMAARRQEGTDDQFQKRQPCGLRTRLHDLLDPSAKGHWEAGLVMRFPWRLTTKRARCFSGSHSSTDGGKRNPVWRSVGRKLLIAGISWRNGRNVP